MSLFHCESNPRPCLGVGSLRVRFFGKVEDWILKSKNGFSVPLLNRLIQDRSDHDAAKMVFGIKKLILEFPRETYPFYYSSL